RHVLRLAAEPDPSRARPGHERRLGDAAPPRPWPRLGDRAAGTARDASLRRGGHDPLQGERARELLDRRDPRPGGARRRALLLERLAAAPGKVAAPSPFAPPVRIGDPGRRRRDPLPAEHLPGRGSQPAPPLRPAVTREVLARLNAMSAEDAEGVLLAFCGSRRWAGKMAAERPFGGEAELFESADRVFRDLSPEDWLEAFRAHPRIGERAHGQAAREPSGAPRAPADALSALALANRDYEERFGHIYIVCATRKSAEEMLDLCRRRLHNDAGKELFVAAEEQRKITRLRLEAWLES